MSISNRHPVNVFVSGKSEPLAEQRLAKVGYKKTKDIPNPPKSVCASIPMIDMSTVIGNPELMDALIPHIRGILENAQDGIIRTLYEGSAYQLSEVSDEQISVGACISFLNAESTGVRLSAESITGWFKDYVKDELFVAVARALKFTDITPDNTAVIEKHCNDRLEIVKLITGKNLTRNSLSEQQKRVIAQCVKIAGDSTIGDKIAAKMAEIEKVAPIEECLELDL